MSQVKKVRESRAPPQIRATSWEIEETLRKERKDRGHFRKALSDSRRKATFALGSIKLLKCCTFGDDSISLTWRVRTSRWQSSGCLIIQPPVPGLPLTFGPPEAFSVVLWVCSHEARPLQVSQLCPRPPLSTE